MTKKMTMSEKELKRLEQDLIDLKNKVSGNAIESKKLLKSVGVYSKTGELKKEYEFLCIPQDQD